MTDEELYDLVGECSHAMVLQEMIRQELWALGRKVRDATARRCAELCQDQADSHHRTALAGVNKQRHGDYSDASKALDAAIRAEFNLPAPAEPGKSGGEGG